MLTLAEIRMLRSAVKEQDKRLSVLDSETTQLVGAKEFTLHMEVCVDASTQKVVEANDAYTNLMSAMQEKYKASE